ncbi:MAG: hypothetical protein HPY83_04585 [Anaerolineae bacterium]|nr:hypothetical protein [Anaerolineae bacterium]
MDYRERIEGDLGGFERLVRQIPGYRGYKERELAREADRLLRERLSKELYEQRDRVLEIERSLTRGGGLSLLGDLDLAVRRLETLSDTIRTASYGYAGLFDAIKVGEQELNALYQHDAGLLDELPALREAVDAVESAVGDSESVRKASAALLQVVSDIRRRWDERREALVSLG